MRLEDWSTLPPACQRVVPDLDSEELIRLSIAYGISGIHAIAGNLWHRHQHQPQVVAPPLVAEKYPLPKISHNTNVTPGADTRTVLDFKKWNGSGMEVEWK
jgi:hypothetical protein